MKAATVEKSEKYGKSPQKRSARAVGAKGERIARRYLKQHGYKILGRNYRVYRGEIDIIALDRENGKTVFVEVKSRKDDAGLIERYGSAADAVDNEKISRLQYAIQSYIWKHPESVNCRGDIIEVYLPVKSSIFQKPRVNHLISAFPPRRRRG